MLLISFYDSFFHFLLPAKPFSYKFVREVLGTTPPNPKSPQHYNRFVAQYTLTIDPDEELYEHLTYRKFHVYQRINKPYTYPPFELVNSK